MKKIKPCIIGLGYVGLPVFLSLNRKFNVIGYDKNKNRVKDLKQSIDTFPLKHNANLLWHDANLL